MKKITSINVYVHCPYERGNLSFDKKSMQIRPHESMKEAYDWRFVLQEGDQVDYFNENYTWVNGKISNIRKRVLEKEDDEDAEEEYQMEVQIDDEERWLNITDAKIQKINSIVQKGVANRYSSDIFVDDFNDVLFDPNVTCCFIARPEATKSQLFVDLLAYAHKELHLFERIAETLKTKEMKIEVTAELIHFVLIVHSMFHRKFAIQYLSELSDYVIDYINNSKESTIRNFTKERYEAVYSALN